MIYSFIVNNKETLRAFKELGKLQLLGVALTFVSTVVVASALIFYGGNWIAGQFSNIFLQSFSFLVVVFLVFYSIGTVSDKVMSKITNGALPKN